jgi:hypothetical protein
MALRSAPAACAAALSAAGGDSRVAAPPAASCRRRTLRAAAAPAALPPSVQLAPLARCGHAAQPGAAFAAQRRHAGAAPPRAAASGSGSSLPTALPHVPTAPIYAEENAHGRYFEAVITSFHRVRNGAILGLLCTHRCVGLPPDERCAAARCAVALRCCCCVAHTRCMSCVWLCWHVLQLAHDADAHAHTWALRHDPQ